MTTEEKQNFLREKILEKGYDTNEFVQFLTDKKGQDGADVSNWSMEDLQTVVTEFIKKHGGTIEEEPKADQKKNVKKVSMFDIMGDKKPKSTQNQPQSQTQLSQPKKTTSSTTKPPENTKNQNSSTTTPPPVQSPSTSTSNNTTTTSTTTSQNSASANFAGKESDYGIISEEVKKCKTLEPTEFFKHDKLEITVSNPEKKEGGFFSKSYVTYMITTMPVQYKVRRRYTDFVWLRTTLLSHFPTNVIPPIPKKTRLGAEKSDTFNLKRARGLEKFMNYLAKDPVIKNSQIFYDFLYIGAETDLNSKKKVYEKVKTLSEVDDFRNKEGKVEIMISSEKENYVENIKDNANLNINLFKKLNTSFKLLYDEINAVTTRMEEISSIWEQIYKLSEKYFDDNTTCECYKQMSNFFSNWSKLLKKQNTVVNIDIREHFKFIRKNFVSMKDCVSGIDYYRSNYQKASKNLIAKKDDLFRRGDPSKWELDPHDKIEMNKITNNKKAAVLLICKKETLNVIGLKDLYGLFLNRNITEYERMRYLNGIKNKEILNTNIKKLTDIMGEFHVCIGEINSALDLVTDENSNDGKCKLKRIPLES